MDFILQDKKKSFEIKKESGEVVKSYSIDVGNYETLKTWSEQITVVEKLAKEISNDPKGLEQLLEMDEKIISMVLGDWAEIWELFGHNIFSVLKLVKALSDLVAGEIADIQKEYV